MSWTKAEITLAHIACSACHWNRPQYELVLRNVAGIRPTMGKISGLNFSATRMGFERYMAHAEASGFVDQKHGPGYWQQAAQNQCRQIHAKIHALAQDAVRLNLVNNPDFLPAFIERQTMNRDVLGKTRDLAECDISWSIKVLEGLKAFLSPIARQRGLRLEL